MSGKANRVTPKVCAQAARATLTNKQNNRRPPHDRHPRRIAGAALTIAVESCTLSFTEPADPNYHSVDDVRSTGITAYKSERQKVDRERTPQQTKKRIDKRKKRAQKWKERLNKWNMRVDKVLPRSPRLALGFLALVALIYALLGINQGDSDVATSVERITWRFSDHWRPPLPLPAGPSAVPQSERFEQRSGVVINVSAAT